MNIEELEKLTMDMNKNLKLSGIEDFDSGSLLNFPLYQIMILGKRVERNAILNAIKIFFRAIIKRTAYKRYKNGDIICYIARPLIADRHDHYDAFKNVTGLLENKTIFTPTKLVGFSLANISTLRLPFVWNKELKAYGFNRSNRRDIVRSLYSGYMDYKEVIDVIDEKQRGLLLYTETTPPSQFLKQYSKKNGITTVCLQHGTYNISEHAKYYLLHWGCDYLAAYSEYAKNRFAEMGGYKGEVVSLGIPKFIGFSYVQRQLGTIKTVGILVDGNNGNDYIYLAIMEQIVVKVCNDCGIKVLVKHHPSDSDDILRYYKDNVHGDFTVIGNKSSSLDFEKGVDAVVCRNTTCFVECVFQRIPTFIYNGNYHTGKDGFLEDLSYPGLNEDIYFDDEKKFRGLIEKYSNPLNYGLIDDLRSYVCGNTDATEEYARFFKKINWL